MKKNRDKERAPLHQSEQLQKRNTSESILVFLVLAIFIFALSIFPSHQQFLQKKSGPDTAGTTEKYIWLTGSPEFHEGLYIFTPENLERKIPAFRSLLPDETPQEEDSMVYAIQYQAGSPRKVSLPPAVANIFFQPIPINRAGKTILTSLPGIGPALAEKIAQRIKQYGPFRSKTELLDIPGIGPEKFAGLVDHITLD